MSAAYALAVPQTRSRAALYGTRAQLSAGDGDVEGYLALAGCDKRAGTASYALRIVNQSATALRARMTCAQLRGEPVPAYPLDVRIAPFSICETLLPVRLAEVGPYDRAIVSVGGGDIAFTLEAPAPQRTRRAPRWVAVCSAAAVFTVGSAFGAASATPRIAGIAAPQRAIAGMPLDVPYAFAGIATLRYELRTPDGRQIAAGLLRDREGTLHFNVPESAGRNVVLDVTVAGPLGIRHSTQRIAIASPPAVRIAKAPVAPRVSEFSILTPVVHAGGTIALAYVTNARSGEIWLLDDAGRLWARAPMSLYGKSIVEVPAGAAGRPMRAVLHARNGKADTLASVAFTALPGAVVRAPAAQSSSKQSAPVLTLSTAAAAPGDTVTVAIAGNHGDAQISLTDASGNAVEQGDIPAGQSAVTLTAPAVSAPATYYVTAAVSDGVGEQTLVKTLSVTPR